MHPAYVALAALQVVFSLVIAAFFSLVGLLRQIPADQRLTVLVIGVAVFLLALGAAAAIAYIYYQRYRWEITDNDIYINSGIIVKKQVHIPFQRVQSIDFHAGIPQRILGIVQLKIETAGGSVNKGVIIPALKLAQAEAFRAEVFARKRSYAQGKTPGGPAVPAVPAVPTVPAVPAVPAAPGGPGAPVPAGSPFTSRGAFAHPATATGHLVAQAGDAVAGLRGVFAGQDFDETAPVEHEYGLTGKELFLSAISNDHTLILAALLVGGVTQLDSFLRNLGFGDLLFDSALYAFNHFALPFIIGSIVVVVVVTYLLSLLNSNFEDWRAQNPQSPLESFPFSAKKMGVSGALFGLEKLNDVARGVIARMDAPAVQGELCAWAEAHDTEFSALLRRDEAFTLGMLAIGRGGKKPRKDFATWAEAKAYFSFYFDELFAPDYTLPEAVPAGKAAEMLALYREWYDPAADAGAWFDTVKRLAKAFGYADDMKAYKQAPEAYPGSVADVSAVLRLAIAGRPQSPDLCEVMRVMGPARVRARLEKMLAAIRKL